MQKLLIHINFLLAFSVLFCSHSAFGQSVQVLWPQNNNWFIIDLGFSKIYWADRNVKANNSLGYGEYYTWSDAANWNTSSSSVTPKWGGYWRTPTDTELYALRALTHDYKVVSPGIRLIAPNNNYIDIPASGFKLKVLWGYSDTEVSRSAYLWSSTQKSKNRAYYFIYNSPTQAQVDVIVGDKDSKLPIRPVIDKIKNVVVKAKYEGQSTYFYSVTADYPKGSTIQITDAECYTYKVYVNDSEVTNFSNNISQVEITTKNTTYEIVFTVKTTNLKATTEDNRKGSVGLKVGDEIE